MLNCADSSHTGANPRRRFRIFHLCIGLVAVAGLGVFVWHLNGQATKLSHKSCLVFVREALVQYAVREGKYPLDLQQLIPSSGVGDRVDPRDLLYVASGRPYDPQGSQRLFYELKARRYGFEVGRFVFYQDASYFEADYGGGG